MFKLKFYIYKLLSLLEPTSKKQLAEIKREIWINKGFYLNDIQLLKLAIDTLQRQEVKK
jgi:hypothetical protein